MTRRIFGIETEYGLSHVPSLGARRLDADQAANVLFQGLVEHQRSTNVFLENGGRLYLDVGSHPEYATAECDQLTDLLSQDLAGQELLKDMAGQAQLRLEACGYDGKLHLFKNNLDAVGNSFGCHENYLLRRQSHFRSQADALVSFFVTRQILTGSGYLRQLGPGRGVTYCFSPRSDQMTDPISAATTRARPIINTRDEPLADAERYRRLHVISGDSNMAPTTTALKVGITHLVLGAMESGLMLDDLTLMQPLRAIRQINDDISGTAKVELADGRRFSALQWQMELFERIQKKNIAIEDPLIPYVWGLWERSLMAFCEQDFTKVSTELDWVIKHQILQRQCQRLDVTLDSVAISRLDLAYHDITDAGLLARLYRSGLIHQVINHATVQAAKTVPPRTTRAYLRGQVIAGANAHRRDLSVDWVHLRMSSTQTASSSIILSDPFAVSNPQVEELLQSLEGECG